MGLLIPQQHNLACYETEICGSNLWNVAVDLQVCESYQWFSDFKCASKSPEGLLKIQVAESHSSFLIPKVQGGAENRESKKFPTVAAEDGT